MSDSRIEIPWGAVQSACEMDCPLIMVMDLAEGRCTHAEAIERIARYATATWQAACAWQRERDAAVCVSWVTADECADAIRNGK